MDDFGGGAGADNEREEERPQISPAREEKHYERQVAATTMSMVRTITAGNKGVLCQRIDESSNWSID
jgi:hypothetical protein